MKEFDTYHRLLSRKPDPSLPDFDPAWLNQSPVHEVTSLNEKKSTGRLLAAAAVLMCVIAAGALYLSGSPSGFDSIEQTRAENYSEGFAAVAELKGSANIVKGDLNKPLYKGDSIPTGWTLLTSTGTVDLVLPDQSAVRVLADSAVRFDSLGGHTVLYQLSGRSLHAVAKQQKAGNYRIISDTGTVAVRGTRFYVFTGEKMLEVAVTHGEVSMINPDFDEGIRVKENEAGRLQQDSRPETADVEKYRQYTAQIEEVVMLGKEYSELLEEIGKLSELKEEKDFEQVYRKPPEVIILRDGRELRGVVASQAGNRLILHTTSGIVAVMREDVIEIRYEN